MAFNLWRPVGEIIISQKSKSIDPIQLQPRLERPRKRLPESASFRGPCAGSQDFPHSAPPWGLGRHWARVHMAREPLVLPPNLRQSLARRKGAALHKSSFGHMNFPFDSDPTTLQTCSRTAKSDTTWPGLPQLLRIALKGQPQDSNLAGWPTPKSSPGPLSYLGVFICWYLAGG